MTQITLRAQNLAKSYKSRQVVKDVSLTVKSLAYSARTARVKPPLFTWSLVWLKAIKATSLSTMMI